MSISFGKKLGSGSFGAVWEATDSELGSIAVKFFDDDDGKLSDHISNNPPFTVGAARALCEQLLCGLSAIHKAGTAHGDLHTENVILVSDDNTFSLKIIDILFSQGFSTQDIIGHSEAPSSAERQLQSLTHRASELQGLTDALTIIFESAKTSATDTMIGRLSSQPFVKGETYARALLAENSKTPLSSVLTELVERRLFDPGL